MEERTTTMTQDEIILELIKSLKQNQMQDTAKDIFETAAYIDSLERKLDQVVDELGSVKLQLAEFQEQQMMKSIRAQLGYASERMENLCHQMKEQLFEVRTEFKEKAISIVTETRKKGKAALNRIAELSGAKEKLEKIRVNARESEKEVEQTINKIEQFGVEMRNARYTVTNAFVCLPIKNQLIIRRKINLFL